MDLWGMLKNKIGMGEVAGQKSYTKTEWDPQTNQMVTYTMDQNGQWVDPRKKVTNFGINNPHVNDVMQKTGEYAK